LVYSALDWGLGHASRSVPILRHLQLKGCQISIAASGQTAELLKMECPWADFLQIPGYGVTYPEQGGSFRSHIFRQLPEILSAIRQEHIWLKKAMKVHHWDAVISDNRYGFWHPDVPSAIITHQLQIISGMGKIIDGFARKGLYAWINNFTDCWVPDFPHEPSLAGTLSHPVKLPAKAKIKYLGPLSRLNKHSPLGSSGILILLSGPEPQRSILESMILDQVADIAEPVTLVRGLPGEVSLPPHGDQLRIHNHLPTSDISKLIQEAAIIICRPGYSTIMDLVRSGRKAVLIPTPGQTEQEYLAMRLQEKGWFPYMAQQNFSLNKALGIKAPHGHIFPEECFEQFKNVVDDFVM